MSRLVITSKPSANYGRVLANLENHLNVLIKMVKMS